MQHRCVRPEIPAGGDNGSRARWTTTLVDLGAIVLSMFVLIFATQQRQPPQVEEAARRSGAEAVHARQVELERHAPNPARARRQLVVARLRQELREAGFDELVTARASRDGVVLELTEPLIRRLTDPATAVADQAAASLAGRLRTLAPLLRGATLTYVGQGVDAVVADLPLVERAARRLGDAGLSPAPDAVLTPSAPAGAPPAELHLILEDA